MLPSGDVGTDAPHDPHNWRLCPYAHPGEAGRRRPPHIYRPVMCDFNKTRKECSHGEACLLARNALEYWLHPDKYRTIMCGHGEACKRNICFFAHNQQELRTPASRAGGLAGAPGDVDVAAAALERLGIGSASSSHLPGNEQMQVSGQLAYLQDPTGAGPSFAGALIGPGQAGPSQYGLQQAMQPVPVLSSQIAAGPSSQLMLPVQQQYQQHPQQSMFLAGTMQAPGYQTAGQVQAGAGAVGMMQYSMQQQQLLPGVQLVQGYDLQQVFKQPVQSQQQPQLQIIPGQAAGGLYTPQRVLGAAQQQVLAGAGALAADSQLHSGMSTALQRMPYYTVPVGGAAAGGQIMIGMPSMQQLQQSAPAVGTPQQQPAQAQLQQQQLYQQPLQAYQYYSPRQQQQQAPMAVLPAVQSPAGISGSGGGSYLMAVPGQAVASGGQLQGAVAGVAPQASSQVEQAAGFIQPPQSSAEPGYPLGASRQW
eukprot:GHRR01009567.1.p1 GENE.GHRR01009567.1~~GHRR01009567.1.p1  ORF type:complete len:478 (+),score=198.61 GHRR01009567.1:469-1902(+)